MDNNILLYGIFGFVAIVLLFYFAFHKQQLIEQKLLDELWDYHLFHKFVNDYLSFTNESNDKLVLYDWLKLNKLVPDEFDLDLFYKLLKQRVEEEKV